MVKLWWREDVHKRDIQIWLLGVFVVFLVVFGLISLSGFSYEGFMFSVMFGFIVGLCFMFVFAIFWVLEIYEDAKKLKKLKEVVE